MCGGCKQVKPLDEFHRHAKKKDGRQTACKQCKKDGHAVYFQTVYKPIQKSRTVAKTAILDQMATAVKSAGCSCCPEKELCCLDFHHVDPATKLFSIANLVRYGCGPAVLKTEIEKCLVLCSNCHRKVHAGILDVSNLPTVVVLESGAPDRIRTDASPV